jgi:hypothetical protein
MKIQLVNIVIGENYGQWFTYNFVSKNRIEHIHTHFRTAFNPMIHNSCPSGSIQLWCRPRPQRFGNRPKKAQDVPPAQQRYLDDGPKATTPVRAASGRSLFFFGDAVSGWALTNAPLFVRGA